MQGERITGLCRCGCGETTSLATQTNRRLGHVKGEPVFYVRGHANRLSPVEYIEENHGHDTPCWIWQRSINWNGYGTVGPMHSSGMAHQLVYERHKDPIPEGLELDHLCGQRACVNPDHLEPVSRAENVRRGRVAKLTLEQAREIRASSSTKAELARQYGVSRGCIEGVVRGWTWQEA